jgi:uncharacterized protein YuzE
MPDHSDVSDLASKSCRSTIVAADVCYISFGKSKTIDHSDEIGHSVRGELMIADFDADGHIIGIELVGRGKPCQT